MDHNFLTDLRIHTHYERNVLKKVALIITSLFALRVVSAEFQTSRSEARHKQTRRKLQLLD